MKEKYPRTIKKDQRKKINKHIQGMSNINIHYQRKKMNTKK